VFGKTKFENLMIHKLAYEWKNIYRALSQVDDAGTGAIRQDEFISLCEKFKVSIIPIEQKQLMKQFALSNDMNEAEALGFRDSEASDMINYRKLSIHLGLHKSSYNFLNKVQSLNKIKNMSKLRQLYQPTEQTPAKTDLFKIEEEGLKSSGKLKNRATKSTIGLLNTFD